MTEQKYRQRGYKDSERGSQPRGDSADKRSPRLEGAPRGRGAERNREEVFRCKACGELSPPDFREDATCPKCDAALHACVQCRFFDTSAPSQCRQDIPAPLPSKSRKNECSLFEPATALDLTGRKAATTPITANPARSAFDQLFKK